MANTYTWTVKHLKSDDRGYAQSICLELQGSDGINTASQNCIVTFVGSDNYKPMSQWQQSEIDALAEANEAALQQEIDHILANQEAIQQAIIEQLRADVEQLKGS